MKISIAKTVLPVLGGALLVMGGYAFMDTPREAPSDTQTIAAQKEAFHAYQKPGAAIRFTHDYAGRSKPGDIETITVTLIDEYPSGNLTVSLQENPGLTLYSDMREHNFSMAGNDAHKFEIQIGTKNEGRHFLNFMTTVELDNGNVLRRAHAIPILVGDKAGLNKTQAADVQTTKSSGGVVVMEAEETITTD